MIGGKLPALLGDHERKRFEDAVQLYLDMGVPKRLARRLAGLRTLYSALDIVDVAVETDEDVLTAAHAYYQLGESLQFGWIREQAERLKVTGRWHALARGSLRDSVDDIQRNVARVVLRNTTARGAQGKVDAWLSHNSIGIARARRVLDDIQEIGQSDFATLSVAISEARKLSTLGGE